MSVHKATIIDGKAIAETLKNDIAVNVRAHLANLNKKPELAVVLVGNNDASVIYVKNKIKACEKAGITCTVHRLPENTAQGTILSLIDGLNRDNSVNGILVQLPLPAHLDTCIITNAVQPNKDIDGLTYINAGHLLVGDKGGIAPCTPAGCLHLIESVISSNDLIGKKAVVVGRSNLVGKPVAQLLLACHCTVTQCHSKTVNLADEIKQADILVIAIGKPKYIKAEWIKPHAIVIDVGINRIHDSNTGKDILCGDVDFENAVQVAGYITPVPGGVGPMTIAGLLQNTLTAFERQNGLMKG